MNTTEPTQEEMRIAIAEHLGWTKCRLAILGSGGGTRHPTAHGFPHGRSYECDCPDYFGSLNACGKAERALTDEQHAAFRCILKKIITASIAKEFRFADETQRSYVSATAEQRARAIFKAITKV